MGSYEIDTISLLPEEMWKYILEFAVANNEKTLQNCNLTCRLWKKLLGQHNFRLKLSLVLPHLYTYLSGNDILNCRSICKKWHSTINQYNPGGDFKTSLRVNRLGTRNNFRSNQVFRNLFANYHRPYEAMRNPVQVRAMRNPVLVREMQNQRLRNCTQIETKKFIFRSIVLTISPNVNVYQDALPYIFHMKKFVKGIHFKFPVRHIEGLLPQFTEILSRFPTLEYLKLSSISVETTDEILPLDWGFRLPALNNLKALNVTELPDDLQEFFIGCYESQLEASNRETYDACHLMCRSEDQFMWKGPIKLLQKNMANRPVTHAHFSISTEQISAPELILGMQNIGQTLKLLSLKLTSGNQQVANISGNACFTKSNVMQPNANLASSFEFLKDLRNLEKLKIQISREMYEHIVKSKEKLTGNNFIIDLVKNLEEIEDLEDDDIVFRMVYKSNIWSLLRKLKFVCITIVGDEKPEGKGYTKRDYTRRELNELYL